MIFSVKNGIVVAILFQLWYTKSNIREKLYECGGG